MNGRKGHKFRKRFDVEVSVRNKDVQATEIFEALKHAGIEVVSVELKEVK